MGRRRRGIMSEELKIELAKDLGFYDTVAREGWEGIRTKDAGNMVKRAIQIAEEKLAQDYQRQRTAVQTMQPVQPAFAKQQPPYNQPGYAGQWGGGNVRSSHPGGPSGVPQPAPAYGYSRQGGFTPLYPSYYAYPQGAAAEAQTPNYLS